MFHHMVERKLNVNAEDCRRCLLSPERFLSKSKYTYFARRRNNTYEVIFRWRKLGITRYYRVIFRLIEGEDTVGYESTPDSDYQFNMRFKLKALKEGRTRITVEASMKAGFLADLLGRKDYAAFIEDLVDKGIGSMLETLAGKKTEGGEAGISCRTCLLYGSLNNYCYMLKQQVDDPDRPLCGGKYYIKYS